MEEASAPQLPALLPSVERAPRQKTTLGSLAVAMLLGALITVTGLYIWGSQIAADQQLASPAQ